MNPYQILGIKSGASEQEIKTAYRRLASIHHPDKGGDTKKFQEIQQAYEKITSGQAAQARRFNWGSNSPHFEDFHDILRKNFSDFDNVNPTVRNPDVTVRVTCTLEEAQLGFSRTIQYLLPQQGQYTKTVDFPMGSFHGLRIRYAGDGATLVQGQPPGDLYCELNVLSHKFWQPNFKTQDVEGELVISVKDAMIGTDYLITDINGQDIKVTVPAGSQPGSKLRLKGRGLNRFQKNTVGDAYLNIQVRIPKLSEDDLNKPLIDLL